MSLNQNVDQPGSLVILKSQEAMLLPPETFLKNRGWHVRSFTDMRETIEAVMHSEPNYILICADHSNTQTRMLHQFFQDKLGIQTIAYFDRHPPNPGPILATMRTSYVLYPVVSGPSIERMVLKIQRDMQIAEARRRSIAAIGGTPSDLIKVKQGATSDQSNLTQRFGMQDFQDLLKTQVSGTPSEPETNIKIARTDHSMIDQGTKFAFKGVRPSSYEKDIAVLQDGSRVACIIIQSLRFSGYLVVALGKNRAIDARFLKTISYRLFAFLRTNGEKVHDREPMDLVLQSVKFEDWSLKQAEVLQKIPHGDDEVLAAFFPFAEVDIKTQDCDIPSMCTIDIDDLADDSVVNFDLYLNLPVNKRNILYTPKGRAFYAAQKDRLKKSGVEQMYLHKSDTKYLASYRAETYLNSCIEAFNSEKNQEL